MEEFDILKLFVDMQQSEASLSCSRNNYFLVVQGFLIIALSQFQSKPLYFWISILGLIISIAWLLTHYRSSNYAKYWKSEAQKISNSKTLPVVYPNNIAGIEMRRVLFILPGIFIFFWLLLALFTSFFN